MIRPCDRCGAVLPAEARFCPSCGAPVLPEGAGEERRVVSVVFADLAGSTELAARLDPERFREVLAAFYRGAASEVASLRGRTEKFVGDAVMAVFGLPQAHDDDALRAIRAAMAIRGRAERLSEELGLDRPLRVRIGVNTGPVAVGTGPADQFLVSGATVSLAARLQQAAEPGEILAGKVTAQLARHAVEFGPPRRLAPRGFPAEIEAHPAATLSARSSRRTIPLVGRQREVTLLRDAFARVGETGRTHLVTILGEPGIGKSRLVDEVLVGLPEETTVLSGRASEYEDDPTFAPIAEMIRAHLGVERDAPRAVLERRLSEVVEGCCNPSESEEVAARLGVALGLAAETRAARPHRAAEVRGGLLTFLDGLARRGPVALRFEDLHLARDEMLDLVDGIVRRGARVPLLVLCVAREQLLDRRPGWGGGVVDSLTIRLEPLSDEESRQLALAAGPRIDDPTAERIARLAGGNPLFIIETTGMLMHEEDGRPGEQGPILPPTVQAVAASRIDHLPERAREVVRKASVFPPPWFEESRLALVGEADPDVLRLLEEEELLEREPGRAGRWRFRHELLREVAYDSLAKRERIRLHLRVAEALGSERQHDLVAAHHLEQAALASLDLDPDDRTLADRAFPALAAEGDRARRRIESRTALDLYGRALALAGPEAAWGPREARVLAGVGEARYWLGEYEESARALRRALALGGDDPWTRTLAGRFLADIALNVEGDADRAAPMFDQALAAARELGDPWALARTLLMAGWVPYWQADLNGARRRFEEALSIARSNPEGDPWAESRALVSITSALSPVGDEEQCLGLGLQALALGERMGDAFTRAVAHEDVANSLRRMMRLDEALPHIQWAVDTFRELGARWELASALGDRGYLHQLAGRLEAAEADLREALALCVELSERSLVDWTAATLAVVLLLRSRAEEAREAVGEATGVGQRGEPGQEAALAMARALVALAEGDREEALRHAADVLGRERRRGYPNPVAAAVWWVGCLFGEEAAGGPHMVADARARLERCRWLHAIHEPQQIRVGLPAAFVETSAPERPRKG